MASSLLYVKNGELSFGGAPLFSDVCLQILREDKICLVGRNGSGKSTLLKTLIGIVELDKGDLYRQPGIKIGYLPQTVEIEDQQTVYDYVISEIKIEEGHSKNDYYYLADMALSALNLNGDKLMSKLSGGKLRKASLAKALVANPDLLFLDEPTNHLDISSIEWLEDFLINYKGGLVCISHDRQFLCNISYKTFWLDRGILRISNKGFDNFEEWSEQIYEQDRLQLERLNKKLVEENLWLQQGVTARRKRNQSRLHNLFDLREKLKTENAHVQKSSSSVKLPPLSQASAARMVTEMDMVSHSYFDVDPPKQTFKNFSLRIIRGEKIGIVGRNGAGKTTFLRLLTGNLKPTTGTVKLGSNVEISYCDQKRSGLDVNKTLWETLCPEGGDTVFISGDKPRHIASYLKDFLFDSSQIKSPVSSLSGGEANRLLLAKILANPGNFLILDEPTNDLDTDTLDMLQDLLSSYIGTLIIVSHDRDFLDRLVTRTLVFEQDGNIIDCIGGYSDYLKEAKQKKIVKEKNKLNPAKIIQNDTSPQRNSKLSYKFQRELELLPSKIDNLTVEINKLEQHLTDPLLYSADPVKFNDIVMLITDKKKQLEMAELRWLELEELKGSN